MATTSSFVAPSSRAGVPVLPCSASDSASDLPPTELGLAGGSDVWCSRALLGVSVSAMLSCDSDLLGVLVLLGGVVSPDRGFSPFLESDCPG